jgi:hypothetical protein
MFIKRILNFNDKAFILKDEKFIDKFFSEEKSAVVPEAVDYWRQYVNADTVATHNDKFLFLQLIEEAQTINDTNETAVQVP